MRRYKNTLLVSLMFLNHIHVLFKGCGYNLVWLINGVSKSLNFSVFLFVKHLTFFIVLIMVLKPKNISKDLLLFTIIVSFLDVVFFISNSNYQIGLIKLGLSALIFLILKSKFNKWVKY